MQYREIVAVTGLGGLFQLMATKSDGAIVRSLADNTTKFIPSRLHNVTPLESIEIYTHGNNVRLHEVLQKMKDSQTERPDAKKGSAKEILEYFKSVFPEMDEGRVYPSDMKKMLKWFEILKGADLLDFSSMYRGAGADGEVPEDAASMPAEGEAQVSEHNKEAQAELPLVEEGEEKPAKKSRSKKAAANDEEGESKPAKKAAKKKADAPEGTEAAPKKTAKAKKKEEE